jgi:hypothetical protein
VVFGLGIVMGLFLARESDEALYRDVLARVAAQAGVIQVLERKNETLERLSDTQARALQEQLRVLVEACPIMRRAGNGWPWCLPVEEVSNGGAAK